MTTPFDPEFVSFGMAPAWAGHAARQRCNRDLQRFTSFSLVLLRGGRSLKHLVGVPLG